MKTIIVFVCFFAASFSYAHSYSLSRQVLDGSSVEFIEYSGDGEWDNYLTVNLPFEPMAELFRQLLIAKRKPLTNRGEAHITVITPVEYWKVLKPKGLSMDEINGLARERNIQATNFEVVCLGRGETLLDKKTEQAYFVVVTSPQLVNFRKDIQSLFVAKGGSAADFVPDQFYPHITLGFTKRDLHESDGIIKDARSCVDSITMVR